MHSLNEWRTRRLFEIAVAIDPERIIQGAPTLDSVKESIWGNTKVPPNIPNIERAPIANGDKPVFDEEEGDSEPEFFSPNSTAPSVNNGGLVLPHYPKFEKFLDRKLTRVEELNKKTNPLGHKGMGHIGSSTFDAEPVKAGDTPTISHGIPVGSPTGQFNV